MIEQALAAARSGLRVFPLNWPTQTGGAAACSCKEGAACEDTGKHPRFNGWQKAATTDEAQIRRWWAREPLANVGIATGAGRMVLDVDGPSGEESLRKLEQQHGDLLLGLAATTGRDGGLHLWFAVDGKVRNSAGKLGAGLDVRGDGGYVVAPPSLHKTGRRYAWIDPAAVITQAPSWLAALVCKRANAEKAASPMPTPGSWAAGVASAVSVGDPYWAAALRNECEAVRTARAPSGDTPGERNPTLNTAAFSLGTIVGAGGLERAHVEQQLLAAAFAVGLSEEEALRTIRSGLDAGVRQPRELPVPHFRFTDLGHGERFAHLNRERAVYVPQWGAWLCWNEKRWTRDEGGTIHAWAKEVPRALLQEASKAEDDDKRKMLAQAATKLEGAPRLAAMLSMASKENTAAPRVFDQHRHLLNVENGTIDLRAGTLRPHDRADRLTKLVPITYDPAASAPRWEQFLREVFAGDEDLIRYMKRAIGYALTGETREQVFFVLHGARGKNGKGRLIRQLRLLLGDAAETTAFATLTADRAKVVGNTPELAKLSGARVVVVGEPDEGVRLSESVIKSLTGEDEIQVCAKFEAPFSYVPQFKVFVHANHAPEIRGTDDAIWRRPQLIPCNVRFDGEGSNPAPDLDLDTKLDLERAGILRWAVEGAAEWYAHGLGTCASVAAATSEYRKESDALGPFVEECFESAATSDAFVTSAEIYRTYQGWCLSNGVDPWRADTLSKRLVARGFLKTKKTGVRGFAIHLRAAAKRPAWPVAVKSCAWTPGHVRTAIRGTFSYLFLVRNL